MSAIDVVRAHLPAKYRQFAKFLVVGGTTWVIDTGIFFVLKHTVLPEKVLTAKIIAVLVAMIVNYILNREWSFRDRGGRERHHEAALFFLLNGIGIGVTLAPLGISHYLLGFRVPNHSLFFENMADFISGSIIGTILAMAFRYWAYRKWVFPELTSEIDADDPARHQDDFSFNVPPQQVRNPQDAARRPQDTVRRTQEPPVQPESRL